MDNTASKKLPRDELFSERLSQAMEGSGKSGKAIAQSAGIDAGYLSNLKKGKRAAPSAPVIRSLAMALGVSEEWLARGTMSMPTELRKCEPTGSEGSAQKTQREKLPGANIAPGVRAVGKQPLDIVDEIRAEVIGAIHRGVAPPPRLLALIGEIEAVLVDRKNQEDD